MRTPFSDPPGRRPSYLTLLCCVVLLAGALAGCASDPEPVEPDVGAIPRSAQPLPQLGSWYAEGTVHVGDRSQRLGRVHDYVIAARTLVYTAAGPGIAGQERGRVCFSDLRRTTCTRDQASRLVVSPDGEKVGYLEISRARKDKYGTSLATSTVLDLTTGRRLVSSTAGMGDPGKDDLGQLYGDSGVGFRGFTATGAAVVDTAHGLRAFPAGGGPGRIVHKPVLAPRDLPGDLVRIRRGEGGLRVVPGRALDSGNQARRSPDGRFLVVDSTQRVGDLRGSSAPAGRPFRFAGTDQPWWGFGTWTGPHAFLGVALNFAQSRTQLYRCDLATRACTLLTTIGTKPGTVDAVRFPGTTGTDVAGIGQ